MHELGYLDSQESASKPSNNDISDSQKKLLKDADIEMS